MDDEDLAALLDKELDMMSDTEEDLGDFVVNARPAEDYQPDESYIDELKMVLDSANSLSHLVISTPESTNGQFQDLLDMKEKDEEYVPANAAMPSQTDTMNTNADLEGESTPSLTAEELVIVQELLKLMVESVERCAPICVANRNLPPMEHSPLILESSNLMIINEDSDVKVDAVSHAETAPVSGDAINDLLDNKILAETRLVKEAQIHAAQESDRIMWDESNKYKQQLETEKQRQEERKRKRAEARQQAIREQAAINVQRVERGRRDRRTANTLAQVRKEQRAREEAERLVQLRRQEEEARDQQLRLERQREAAEALLMASAEAESRRAWAALQAYLESLRQKECALFAAEDSLAAAIRADVLQARRKLELYQQLAAEEDVEYEIAGYDSDCDSNTSDGTESARDEEVESDAIPCGKTVDVVANASVPISAVDPGMGLSVQLHRVTPTSGTAPHQPQAATLGKPAPAPAPPAASSALRPAPRNPKAVVSVDPTQGKRWGGSINTAAWGSASQLEPAQNASSPADAGASPQEERYLEVKVTRPVAFTLKEIEALEHRRQEESQVRYAPMEIKTTFQRKETTGTSPSGEPPVIAMLRHWHQWWSTRSAPRVPFPRPASTSAVSKPRNISGTSTSVAEKDNEEALSNSMVDLETDPLLAQELDFCVEGLSSTTFLSKFVNLTKLAINVNKIADLNGLSTLAKLVNVSAKDNKISSVEALSGLQQLRYLHLDSNRITDISPLSGLSQLVVLCVNSNHVAEIPPLNCPALQRLELSRNRITALPEGCLQGVPALNHLNLSSNQITTLCGETLSACAMLQTLLLSENQLRAVPAPLRLPLLKNLRLNMNRITTLQEWTHLADRPWPLCTPSLQKLVLSDNQITHLPRDIFAGLLLLEELDLSFNALTDTECLTGLSSCRLLSSLHIQDNIFTTVPVNTGAGAGTSRTALLPPQLQQLTQRILSLCPTLETLSGNRIDRALFADALVQLRSRKALEQFQRSGAWLPPGGDWTSAAYQHEPCAVQEVVATLQAHHLSQNMLTVKERAVKKDQIASNKSQSKRVNIDPSENAKNGKKPNARDWDAELGKLLNAQLTQLHDLCCDVAPVVFISFSKEDVGLPPVSISQSLPDISPVPAEGTESSASEAPSAPVPRQPRILPPRTVVTLQRCFRKRRALQRVRAAMGRVKYQDSELDDIFASEAFDFDQEMMDLASLEDEAPPVMVYGDHIRKRSRPGSSSRPSVSHPPAASAASAGLVHHPQQGHPTHHQAQHEHQHNWVLPADDAHSPPKIALMSQQKGPSMSLHTGPDLSRPSTGMSSLSAQTDAPDSAARAFGSGASSPAGSRADLSARSGAQDHHETITMMSSARRSERATAAKIGQEWGITDPKLLATLMKQAQRTQSFAEAKERKEQEKDPQYRLERFQKTAHRGAGASTGATSANTKTSGSFGGAPKTIRGDGKRKPVALKPAWMRGPDGDENESEG